MACGAVFAVWRSVPSGAGLRLRLALAALRLLALAALITPALNIGRAVTSGRAREAVWTVLIDRSGSMGVNDAGGKTRLGAALADAAFVRDSAPGAELLTFAGDLDGPPADLGALKADGDSTSVTKALSSLLARLNPAGPGRKGVILLSDGRETSGSEGYDKMIMTARAFDIKVYPKPYGAARPADALELLTPKTHFTAFAGQKIRIPFTVRNNSSESAVASVTLSAPGPGGAEEKKTPVKANDSAGSFFEFCADTPGCRELKMSLSGGRSRGIFVSVLRSGVSALMLEGYPFWDSKFMARLMINESKISLTSLNRVSQGKYFMVKSGGGGGGFADEDTVSAEVFDRLDSFDLVIIGRGMEHFLDAGRAGKILDFVSGGKAVLFARGKPCSDTLPALEEMEPVSWGGLLKGKFHWRPSAFAELSGFAGEVLPGPSDPVWGALPPAEHLREVKKLKPFAEVLIEGVPEKSLSGGAGAAEPVLIFMRFGAGAVAAVNSDEMWTWDFLPDRADAAKFYSEFWINLMDWLPRGAEFAPGAEYSLISDKKSVSPGTPVFVRVASRKNPGAAPDITLEISKDGKTVSSVKPSRQGEKIWTASVTLREPGDYKISLAATSGEKSGAETAEISVPLTVASPPAEMDNTNSGGGFLARLAADTGGSVITPGAALAETLLRRQEPPADERQNPLDWRAAWDNAWILALILAAALADYWLRRRNGLV
jgi:hypothetical protein